MNQRDEREWWDDWAKTMVFSKWGGEMTTNVESMYQAFKARLMGELVAGLPSVLVDRDDGSKVLGSPLIAAPDAAGRGGDESLENLRSALEEK